jgi:hypothetical protein
MSEPARKRVVLPTASDSDAAPALAHPSSRKRATLDRVRLLVSACLMGEKVRYDGQHKYDAFLVEMLGRFVEWERVCYRQSLTPLVVPLTLIKHHLRKYEVSCLARQAFLSPYPAELMLRNHV